MKTIDVLTPQNVKLELQLAPAGIRIAAFALDQVFFLVLLFLITYTIGELFSYNSTTYEIFIYFIFLPFIIFYSMIMELIWNGQTIGKKLLGIRVMRMDGEPVGVDEVLSRWFMRLVDILMSAGSLALLMVSTSRYRQRFGDVLGGTIVVRERNAQQSVTLSHVMKLDTKDSYEPVYPRARLLSEDEALLLKRTLVRYESRPNEGHQKAIVELSNKLVEVLEIKKAEKKHTDFLRTLLKDYIVLTR
ncbi:RDD family protein [Phaeocystidibacter luteus]|uniref:RDD family protein n=1 Tax=Phaeocystidibacter luteus TaxID=911197 RepID=A0A6N6RLE1_9FLAO|nr:RDD family protein [Phaeocystidibacter luteus]KAB2814380.1 RDD family protein [Phaeocystidibacter luteus]